VVTVKVPPVHGRAHDDSITVKVVTSSGTQEVTLAYYRSNQGRYGYRSNPLSLAGGGEGRHLLLARPETGPVDGIARRARRGLHHDLFSNGRARHALSGVTS
jgi:hypothetical protein